MYFLSGQTKETARSVTQLTNKIHILEKVYEKYDGPTCNKK